MPGRLRQPAAWVWLRGSLVPVRVAAQPLLTPAGTANLPVPRHVPAVALAPGGLCDRAEGTNNQWQPRHACQSMHIKMSFPTFQPCKEATVCPLLADTLPLDRPLPPPLGSTRAPRQADAATTAPAQVEMAPAGPAVKANAA